MQADFTVLDGNLLDVLHRGLNELPTVKATYVKGQLQYDSAQAPFDLSGKAWWQEQTSAAACHSCLQMLKPVVPKKCKNKILQKLLCIYEPANIAQTEDAILCQHFNHPE